MSNGEIINGFLVDQLEHEDDQAKPTIVVYDAPSGVILPKGLKLKRPEDLPSED